jgi:hypothetical protein
MRLKRLDGACYGGTCPTLYESDRGTIVVQGWKVTEADVDVRTVRPWWRYRASC